MHEVAPVGAGHPLYFPHVGDLATDQVGEYPDGHVGLWRLFRIILPIVLLEGILVVLRHPVGDEHDGLIASGALLLGAECLEQREGGVKGQSKVGDPLRLELRDGFLELAHIHQIRLDQGVVETRYYLQWMVKIRNNAATTLFEYSSILSALPPWSRWRR